MTTDASFGTPGIGHDDISFTTFTITADEIINFENFGARLMSVGPDRLGSSKLTINPNVPVAPVPEPTTIFLLVAGLLGLTGINRMRKKRLWKP
jgi:hypothetical protein